MTRFKSYILTFVCMTSCGIASAEPPKMPDIAIEDIPKVEVEDLIQFMTPLEGTTPAQWRVMWYGDASTEATISWTTAEEGSKHRVLYGKDPKHLNLVQESPPKARRPAGKNAYFHHTKITGLEPDTHYYFVMESDGVRSKTLYFRTAPTSGTGFSIIHGGDSRSGHTNRCRMNLLIAAYARNDKNIIAFAHGGDFIDTSGWNNWRLWLSQHELTTATDGRVLPLIPTKGNHDRAGTLYERVFGLESKHADKEGKGSAAFTTRIGKDVAMVTLNTNHSGSAQADWLEKQLSQLRPETRWLLVQYHRPMFPAVKGPAKQAPIFVPLFEKYNVDLACESDGHCIKRTVPIRDGQKDPTGVVYIGEGGLGVGQKKPGGRWYLEGGKRGSGHHFMVLNFTDETLRCRTFLMNNKVFDDFSLKAR
ncbi:MAG: metallophosphoesterase family protein [Akkermansiaceae bacterium]|nr:metallophosphoesterase family protein [Akkermansiaceae bacterium]